MPPGNDRGRAPSFRAGEGTDYREGNRQDRRPGNVSRGFRDESVNEERPTHLDLFSGIGGFALAARWAGFVTIGFCEIDPYCQRVLAKNFLADAGCASDEPNGQSAKASSANGTPEGEA